MKNLYYILLGISIRMVSTLVIRGDQKILRTPESKKLEVRFYRDGEPTEINTKHNLIKIDDYNSTDVKVNGKNPYSYKDNIDPYLSHFDQVYAAHKSGSLHGVNSKLSQKNEKSMNKGFNEEHKPQGTKQNTEIEDGQDLSAEQLKDAEEIVDHLHMSMDGKPSKEPVMLNPNVVKMIINYLTSIEKKKGKKPANLELSGEESPTKVHEEIAEIQESTAVLKDKLVHMHDHIERLKSEIERLRAEKNDTEADELEQEKVGLEEQEYNLGLEAEEQEDIELREELENLQQEKEHLIEDNASDEQLAQIDGEIEGVQDDLSHLDEHIKTQEVEHILKEVDALKDEEDEILFKLDSQYAESPLDEGKETKLRKRIEDIHAEIKALLDEATEIAENHQIEEELRADIQTASEEISALENSTGHERELKQLKIIRRKLTDLKGEIELEDTKLSSAIEEAGKSTEEPRDIPDEEEPLNNDDYTDNDNNSIGYDQPNSGAIVAAPGDQTYKETKNQLENKIYKNEIKSFTQIPKMLDLLHKISNEYKTVFANLPSSHKDIPSNYQENTKNVLEVYNRLERVVNTFDIMRKPLIDQINEVKNEIELIDTEEEGILEFYDVADLTHTIRNEAKTPNGSYINKLGDIKEQTNMVGESLTQIRKSLDSLSRLDTWIENETRSIKSNKNNSEGFTAQELISLVSELTPKLMLAKDDVTIVIEEIERELKIIEDQREPILFSIEELDELSGRYKEGKSRDGESFTDQFLLYTKGRPDKLHNNHSNWERRDDTFENMNIIEKHLEQNYNVNQANYAAVISVVMGLIVWLI